MLRALADVSGDDQPVAGVLGQPFECPPVLAMTEVKVTDGEETHGGQR
jgi:hypothetical protein